MIKLIIAVSDNGIVGDNGKLCWHIKEELQFFKKNTIGSNILMGRKTFEGMNKITLPKRHTYVATSNKNYDGNGATVIHDPIALCKQYQDDDKKLFICGGVKIYNQLYKYCDELIISTVHLTVNGDTEAPEIDYSLFEKTSCEKHNKFTVQKWIKKT